MRIANVRIERFSAPLKQPFRVAYGTMDSADSWMVRVETDEGLYGLGSAAPLPFVTGETMDTCRLVLKDLAEALMGADALDIEGAHALMDARIHGNGSAKCAFDIALHDIAGKYRGLPLYRLLGGSDPVVVNDVTVGIDSPERMRREAERCVSEMGFDILKVKIGLVMEHDLEALSVIRSSVGDDVRIRVDANQGYSVETALAALGELEALRIDAAEQFLPWWDFDGAAELMRRNTTSVKLMLDESIHDVHDARRAAALHAADFFNIKLMKCGGLLGGAEIADVAERAGVGCMVGCMMENKISLTAGISLVAAKGAVVEADCDSFTFFVGDDDGIEGGFTREGGTFRLLDRPGLGIELDF